MLSSLLVYRVSSIFILHCSYLFQVHVSQAYRDIDCTSDRISRILYFIAIYLSFQTMLSLVISVIVRAVLVSISDLDHISSMILPRYFNLSTIYSSLSLIFISELKCPSYLILIRISHNIRLRPNDLRTMHFRCLL